MRIVALWSARRLGLIEREKPGEARQLTEQFFVTLRAKVGQANNMSTDEVFAIIEQLLKRSHDDHDWLVPYEIEQLLCLVFDEQALAVELKSRVNESQRKLDNNLHQYHMSLRENAGTDIEMQRAALLRIVDDLQWRYMQDALSLEFRSRARLIAGYWLMFGIFVFTLFTMWYAREQAKYIGIALAAGLLGATFSMKIGVKRRLEHGSFEDLKLMRFWDQSLPRVFLGMGAAVVFLFLVLAGLLSGRAFPLFHLAHVTGNDVSKVVDAARTAAQLPEPDAAAMQEITRRADAIALLLSARSGNVNQPIDQAVASLARTMAGRANSETDAQQDGRTQRLLQAIISSSIKQLHAGNPNFELDRENLILLIVWCFLAGFSEALVPSLLARVERQAGSKEQPAPPTPTPTPTPETNQPAPPEPAPPETPTAGKAPPSGRI